MILQLVIMAKLFRHVAGVDVTAIVAGEDRVTIRLTGGQNDLFGVVMTGSRNGFRIGMADISLAGVGLNAVLGAGCRSGHHAIVPIVVQRRCYLLLNQRGMADFTFLALGQAGLRAGCRLRGNNNGGMFRLGDGFRPCCFAPCAGVGLDAVLGAGCRSGHHAIVPIVVQRRCYLLLNQRGMADFTFLALGQAGLRAGCRLRGNNNGGMFRLGDGFRPCCFAPCAGVGLDAVLGAGCRSGHHAIVPIVAQYLRFTLFGFPAFSALMGLYAGFRTGSFLRCCPLPPLMALGRNGAASLDGGFAILTIKIAGIALFGAGGFLLVYGNRVDVVVGVHLAHFSVVRMVALHILPRPPIPLLPDTVPHLFFFVDAGGFGNGRPTVRIVIMAIGSQHTVIWCVAVCLRRPTPITTAGVALFRHRGVCRKAADRNAGTQTQQQAQTCRKFPSSASHRVKPPLFP